MRTQSSNRRGPRAQAAAGRRLAFFLPSLAGGGAERVMINLAAGFADLGYLVDLVLVRAEGPMMHAVPAAVRVIDLNATRALNAVVPLARYLRAERPTALLAALDHANLVAMAASCLPGIRTRIVISIHVALKRYIDEANSAWERAIPWLMLRCQRLADGIVAVSEGAAREFAALARVPRERVHVIYNSVVTPALSRAAADPVSHPWFAHPTSPVVLALGRLERQKNFRLLIEAFGRVHRRVDARLVILGEGSEREALEADIRRLKLSDVVALPGFVENPYPYIARSAAVVLSSDWEGLPTVLIESLALGTPVVSTDCPSGPREILENGALGRLVPVGDADRLAEAIVATLTTGHVPVEASLSRYTPEVVLAQYQRVLGLLL